MTQQVTAKSHKQLISGLLFLTVVIVVLVYAAVQLSYWLEDEQQAPLQSIEFSGERIMINDQQMEILIRQQQPGSFFQLDVQQVHQLLEAQPWVYRASVRKQWPNRLKIYLVEQQPVAQWNGDMLLNQYGDSFQARIEAPLPLLYGPGGSEKTALEGYKAMQSLLANAGLKVAELMLSERFAWRIRLSSGVQLNLGRSEFIDRLQRFIDIYPLLLQQTDKAVDYVDLRYDTGVAVGWKQPAEQ